MNQTIIRRTINTDDLQFSAEIPLLLQKLYGGRHLSCDDDLKRDLGSLIPPEQLAGLDQAISLLVAALIVLIVFFATRNAKLIPGRLQNVVEMLVEYLYDFIVGILGTKHGPRHVPFLGSLFIYILAMNLFGLIPLMDSPTSSLNVTVGLALCVFFYSQFIGFKELGVVGYIDHMMGSPRTAISWLPRKAAKASIQPVRTSL